MTIIMSFDFGMYWMLLSPKQRREHEERERRCLQRYAEQSAEPWDEDKTKFKNLLCLEADSWTPLKVFDTEPFEFKSGTWMSRVKKSPSGMWGYGNRKLPAFTKLELAQNKRRGDVFFDGEVVIPVLFDMKTQDVIMSYTPMEILTQRQGIRLAKGKVLIGGLGMGYLLRKVAAKKSVKEIVVVEISEELLDWYGNDLCKEVAEETGKPVEVICDDVVNQLGNHGEETRHLVDVWESYPTDYDMLQRRPGWQDALDRTEHFWGWGVTTSYAY